MTLRLKVARVVNDVTVHVGTITRSSRGAAETFSYAGTYLERDDVIPLSLSLPLDTREYGAHEIRPYFEGLLPEGPARDALAAALDAPEDDYLELLSVVGLDCIGDVVIRREDADDGEVDIPWDVGSYVPLSDEELRSTMQDLSTLAHSNGESRLSLAGTQGKVGLAHDPSLPMSEGWFRPEGGAASTHIMKTSNLTRIAEFEMVCMGAANLCGLHVPHVEVLSFGRPIACVERFDRNVRSAGETLHVQRLHQEDLAQAFGVGYRSKYLELEGGTYSAIADLLRRRSPMPLVDLENLARIAVFDYLVGNCDNHLKNLSIVYKGTSMRLAPAYDIVCTTFFERFSREMGRMLGTTRMIDEVAPSDFAELSRQIGLGLKGMRRICSDMSERIGPTLMEAGERGSATLESLPYSSEDIFDDMAPRLGVVNAFVRGM